MRKASILILFAFAIVGSACGGGEDSDAQATIDAAVAETVAAFPTATLNLQATIDVIVDATAVAGSTRPPTASSTPTPVPTLPVVQSAEIFYTQSMLEALLASEDIPALLGGDEIKGVFFQDFSEVADAGLLINANSFTGLNFQSSSTSLNFQIIDLKGGQSAVYQMDDFVVDFTVTELSPGVGDRSMRLLGSGLAAVSFAIGNDIVTIGYLGATVGQVEWDALEDLAFLIHGRM